MIKLGTFSAYYSLNKTSEIMVSRLFCSFYNSICIRFFNNLAVAYKALALLEFFCFLSEVSLLNAEKFTLLGI